MLIAINNLDAIISKTSSSKEAQDAKEFKTKLIEQKNIADKKYQEICPEMYKEFAENYATRERYAKEYKENMYQAHRFRERALLSLVGVSKKPLKMKPKKEKN